MPQNNSKAQKALRKEQAEARAAERAKRSGEQQIAAIDARLGAGVGARKERADLA